MLSCLYNSKCCGGYSARKAAFANRSCGTSGGNDAVVEMELNDQGIYECKLNVELRRKAELLRRRGKSGVFNRDFNNSTVKELIVYSPIQKWNRFYP